MYWRMFNAEDDYPASPKNPAKGRMRLHLIAEAGDNFTMGSGTSYGYVEQSRLPQPHSVNLKPKTVFTVHVNFTDTTVDVPDLETGMSILMINVKGT